MPLDHLHLIENRDSIFSKYSNGAAFCAAIHNHKIRGVFGKVSLALDEFDLVKREKDRKVTNISQRLQM